MCVCAHLRGQAEDLLHQLLGLGGFLQEQFDDGRQELQLNLEEHMETGLEPTGLEPTGLELIRVRALRR